MGVYKYRGYKQDKQEGLYRELKMIHIDFAILTVIYLRFIKCAFFKEGNCR